MKTPRMIRCMSLPLTTVLASLLALSACEGDKSQSAPEQTGPAGSSSSVSIPMGSEPEISAAVRAEIADRKAADPNVNISLSDDGATLTGDPEAINGLATSLTDKYSNGNTAMGYKWYCLYNGGACGGFNEDGKWVYACHSGKYLGSFFAWSAVYARQLSCGGSGSVDVKGGTCPTDGSCLPN